MYDASSVKPTPRRVLVLRDAAAPSSPILVSEVYVVPPNEGVVLRSASDHVPEGARVWWGQQAGHAVALAEGDGVILHELEVLALRG